MTVTDAMVAAARIAFRDAAVIRPGYDSIDYDVAMRAAMSNSFAFGGINASLVVRKV